MTMFTGSKGQRLCLTGFRPGLLPSTKCRLLAMGLVPGTILTFLRKAPLGDPIMIEVCGSQLCIRQQDLESLQLQHPLS